MLRRLSLFVVLAASLICCAQPALAQDLTCGQAIEAMHKAVAFFNDQISIEGGYLWQYADDLSLREGEGRASETTAWVQPPGTPSVGNALLAAYQRTGDALLLEAAKRTAHALVKGQLESGGWDYRIMFDPEDRAKRAYRVPPSSKTSGNVSTLDDNTTQAALRFLMDMDKELGFKDEAIHEAVLYGLDKLLGAQYPIGAWPQRFVGPRDPEKYPVKKASYPAEWSREYQGKDYSAYYTFNDNTIADAIATMFDAYETYGDERYRASAEKAGEFILMAQMPDPQPAWAQQYDPDMHPAWARKFEPPSVTGGESHGVMRTLMFLYRQTGDAKYLEPIPRAIAYLRSSQLPDGRLARFYELETNKPLYFTKDYKLTYSSDDMPTHYGFIVGSGLDQLEAEYNKLKAMDPAKLKPAPKAPEYTLTADLAKRAKAIVSQLDDRGAWVEKGSLRYHEAPQVTRVIACSTFSRNLAVLSEFIAATAPEPEWTPLFNGKDLTGWEPTGNATWLVEDGCLIGRQGPDNAPGDLFTVKDFADFEVSVTYKIVWPANSGVWFRYQAPDKSYQADILEYKNPVCYSGTIYCPGKMFLSMNEDPAIINREGWNTMVIRAQGDHLKVTLNGVVTGDVHEDSFKTGKIGFQIHPGDQFGPMEIAIKEMKIRTL